MLEVVKCIECVALPTTAKFSVVSEYRTRCKNGDSVLLKDVHKTLVHSTYGKIFFFQDILCVGLFRMKHSE